MSPRDYRHATAHAVAESSASTEGQRSCARGMWCAGRTVTVENGERITAPALCYRAFCDHDWHLIGNCLADLPGIYLRLHAELAQPAVTEANSVVLRAYRKTRPGAQPGRQRPPKPGKKAAREAAIRQAVTEAAGRAVTGALAQAAQRSSVPAARPVHELDETGLAEAIGTAAAAGMVSPFWTAQEAAPAPPAAQPAPPADKPLHELDWETADGVIAASLADPGRQAGLVSPFWAGSRG